MAAWRRERGKWLEEHLRSSTVRVRVQVQDRGRPRALITRALTPNREHPSRISVSGRRIEAKRNTENKHVLSCKTTHSRICPGSESKVVLPLLDLPTDQLSYFESGR